MGTNVELGERVEAYLNLIHLRRPNLRITPHSLNMRHPKIANPNTLRLPLAPGEPPADIILVVRKTSDRLRPD
jgi:hypothetical protein